MVNNTVPIPTEWIRVKGWIVEHYVTTKEVWCNSPDGHTFIIKLSTYEYPNIPQFVQKALHKTDYLNEWVCYQIKQAYKRLSHATELYRRFIDNQQETPLKPEFTEVMPLDLFIPFFIT